LQIAFKLFYIMYLEIKEQDLLLAKDPLRFYTKYRSYMHVVFD